MSEEHHPLRPLREEVAPDAAPAFRDRLEAGLRVAHAARSPRRSSWRPRVLVALPALAVVLAVATVALLARDDTAVAALELRDASNVIVTLPTGREVRDPADGFTLTDGAVVRVGDGGAVTIDDVVLSAGTVVTVRDGSLVSDVAPTTTDSPAPIDRPTDRPAPVDGVSPADAVAPTSTARPETDLPADTAGPPEPPVSTRPRDRPADTPPSPNSAPAPAPPTSTEAPTSTTTTAPRSDGTGDVPPGDAPVSLALRLFARDEGVRVVWRVEGLPVDRAFEVVVVRTTDGSEPDVPGGTVVAGGPHGEFVETRDSLPAEIVRLRYRVVVLDAGGGVVARGAVQTLDRR